MAFRLPFRSTVSDFARAEPKLQRAAAKVDRNFAEIENQFARPYPWPVPGTLPPAIAVSTEFGASWTNYGSPWASARYWIDPDGWVHLDGLVKRTAGAVTTVLTLPAGYRPPWDCIFVNVTGGVVANAGVTVASSGAVVVTGYVANGDYLSLSGLRFFAGTVDETYAPSALYPGTVTHGITFEASLATFYDARGAVWHQRLSDGLCRGMGYYQASTVATWPQAWMNPSVMCDQAYTDIFGTFNWSGAAVQWGRLDMQHLGAGMASTFHTAGANTALGLHGIGIWPGNRPDNTWTNLTLQNAWAAIGVSHRTPMYRRDNHGVVHLRGLMAGGLIAANTLIATLPVGFRPLERHIFALYGNSAATALRLDVYPDGGIYVSGGGGWPANTYVTLANVFFRTT